MPSRRDIEREIASIEKILGEYLEKGEKDRSLLVDPVLKRWYCNQKNRVKVLREELSLLSGSVR